MNSFLRKTLILITSVAAITYFAGCFTQYISPLQFWPMAYLALAFPYLSVLIIVLSAVWMFIKRKISILLFLILLIGFRNLSATFALASSAGNKSKNPASLRILSWNVRGLDNPHFAADTPGSTRRQILTYIKNANADVLCLQEFVEHSAPNFLSNTKSLVQLGYRYVYRTDELFHYFDYGTYKSGSAIFSKIPLLSSGKSLLGDSSYPEHLAYIDVLVNNKPARIFTTHFKSLNLFAGPNDTSSVVLFHNDGKFVYNTGKFEKLKVFAQEHTEQAKLVKAELEKSPYPVIYTADMNSVPTSFPYAIVSRQLQDAFLKKGFGLGPTLVGLPATLRIDFLLVDRQFNIQNYSKGAVRLSDHYPQIVDISWKQ